MSARPSRCRRSGSMCPPVCPVWDCDALRCGEVLRGFRVDRCLGKGSFGAVYRATSVDGAGQAVAIKIYAGDVKSDPLNGKARIRQEEQILRALKGKGAPLCLGAGSHKGRPYVMMDYLDPIDAEALPKKAEDIKRFAEEVLEALASMHQAGWVHCDLKPGNLAHRRDNGKIVLIDFGASHLMEDVDQHICGENTINVYAGQYNRVGTIGYMPPELSYCASRDVFAFGHLMRDCFRADVPIAWSVIINKCIANRAECRYSTIDEVLSDVRNLDGLARNEMEQRVRQWRQDQVACQRKLVQMEPVKMSGRELLSRIDKLRDADKRFHVGENELLIDFDAMGLKTIKVTSPVFLRKEKLLVVRGAGVIRMDLAGDPNDTHSVVLLKGATLINSSRVPPYGSGFNYCVGEHCYVNLKGLPLETKLVQGSHWTSDAGNAFIRCGGPDCVADLLSDVDLALWDDTPIVHDEYFGRGAYANRPGLARYLCENGDYFEAMGVQRQDLLTRLNDAFGSMDWLDGRDAPRHVRNGKKRSLVCLGAIIGNIIASRFGHSNPKTRDFELFVPECRMTADGSMTVAIMSALLAARNDPERLASCTVRALRTFGRLNHDEFGVLFQKWIFSPDPQPYGSWGNGAAMRVSPCAWVARSLDEALELARVVTGITHNHPEGIKGAEAVTAAIFLARQGRSPSEIRDYIRENFYPSLTFTLDEIRDSYEYDSGCPGSVPQALEAFFEATSFEDAIRNAVSIGGDVDTTAAIAASIAEAEWGIHDDMIKTAVSYIDRDSKGVVKAMSNVVAPMEHNLLSRG